MENHADFRALQQEVSFLRAELRSMRITTHLNSLMFDLGMFMSGVFLIFYVAMEAN